MSSPVTIQAHQPWPALPLDGWRGTYATLHMWSQVIGKVCLALTPLTNHFWNIALKVTPTGLTTPMMVAGEQTMTARFDFIAHELVFEWSDGRSARIGLAPQTVAAFHEAVMDTLHGMGVDVRIWRMPVEVPDPIPFDEDTVHREYDPAAAQTFWRVLLAVVPVFEEFRGQYVGKSSPVHFFWGSFDLAVTRFSGRPAPERPGGDAITREAYSHEVISHGFWPGSGAIQEPAFYAYAAPEPDGFSRAPVSPAGAVYSRELSEFILPYEAVRTARSPAADLTSFLQSTYDAAAALGAWPGDLERKRP
jgi:hypothetical protein